MLSFSNLNSAIKQTSLGSSIDQFQRARDLASRILTAARDLGTSYIDDYTAVQTIVHPEDAQGNPTVDDQTSAERQNLAENGVASGIARINDLSAQLQAIINEIEDGTTTYYEEGITATPFEMDYVGDTFRLKLTQQITTQDIDEFITSANHLGSLNIGPYVCFSDFSNGTTRGQLYRFFGLAAINSTAYQKLTELYPNNKISKTMPVVFSLYKYSNVNQGTPLYQTEYEASLPDVLTGIHIAQFHTAVRAFTGPSNAPAAALAANVGMVRFSMNQSITNVAPATNTLTQPLHDDAEVAMGPGVPVLAPQQVTTDHVELPDVSGVVSAANALI